MRAITIWQPWASAIAYGPKRVENRSWRPPRSFRLPFDIAIHASRGVRKQAEAEERFDCFTWGWSDVGTEPEDFPRGSVLAVARLVRCRQNAGFPHPPWEIPGDIGWVLDNVRALREPVPCKGMQGLWTLPDDVEASVVAQLVAS